MKVSIRTLTLDPNAQMVPEQLPPGTMQFFQNCHFDGDTKKWQIVMGHVVVEDGDQRQVFGVQSGIQVPGAHRG